MLFPVRLCPRAVGPPTCCAEARVRILRQRRGPAGSLFLTPVSSALLLLCRCPFTSVSNSKYQWPMGAAAPAVAQWIPLHGICHDFVHGWQWREVVRTKKALRSLSDLRTPPWHFLNVELLVLFKEVLLRNSPWQRLHIAMKANHISAMNQMQMLAALARSEFRRPSLSMQKTPIMCVKLKRIVHH